MTKRHSPSESVVTAIISGPSAFEPDPGAAPLPCIYCRAPIPSDTFRYWSGARRLVSATCPTCRRRMTLLTTTWRRWSEPAAPLTG